MKGKSKRESDLWVSVWSMPQAVVWEEQRLEWTVAMYVRSLTHAEKPDSTPPARTLVRQFMDDLGLTAGGMAKNGWRIASEPAKPAKADVPAGDKSESVRDRLKLVRDGVA